MADHALSVKLEDVLSRLGTGKITRTQALEEIDALKVMHLIPNSDAFFAAVNELAEKVHDHAKSQLGVARFCEA